MVLVAGLAYVLLSVLDAGVFGALLAVLLSRRGKGVSAAGLGFWVLVFSVASDLVVFAAAAPLDLTLTTGNPVLVEILGSPDLSEVFRPSFGALDAAFYALDALVGTCCGKFAVAWLDRRGRPEAPPHGTS